MKPVAALLLLLLALPAIAAAPPVPAHPRSALAAEAHLRLDRVMQEPAFGHEVRHMTLALRQQPKPRREQFSPPAWLDALVNLLGALARLVVALLLAGLAYAVYRSRAKWLPLLRAILPTPAVPARQEPMPGVAPPATLPDDVAAAAELCWREGDRRGALSLLYRGAVARLDLPAQATEGETLRLVRQRVAEPVVTDFTQLVRAWQGIAYAQRPPADFEALLAGFRRHFSGPVAP